MRLGIKRKFLVKWAVVSTSRQDYWSILKFNILNKRLTLLFVFRLGAGGWNRFLGVLSFMSHETSDLGRIPVSCSSHSIWHYYEFNFQFCAWSSSLSLFYWASMALMGATAVHCDSKWNCHQRERARDKENIENKLKFMSVWENGMWT